MSLTSKQVEGLIRTLRTPKVEIPYDGRTFANPKDFGVIELTIDDLEDMLLMILEPRDQRVIKENKCRVKYNRDKKNESKTV